MPAEIPAEVQMSAGRVEQLNSRMEHDGNASRHGSFRRIYVISAMIGSRYDSVNLEVGRPK